MFKYTMSFALVAIVAILFAPSWANATEMDTLNMEDSTVSPIAHMAIIDSEMKTSTEKPPVMESTKQEEKPSSQRHTVADFIIHPLIAFKPRNPEEETPSADGKQAASSTSSTVAPPWQLFGFNAGQGLGSSVSSLAGSVTGWLNDRLQLPQLPLLTESPIRDSTNSSSTTTTPRPDIVVQVQHRPSTRRPLISINNRRRPNQPNFDSEENVDDDDEYDENDEDDTSAEGGDNETSEEGDDGYNSEEDEDNEIIDKDEDDNVDDDEEENHSQRPNNRRGPNRNQNVNNRRRRIQPQNNLRQQNNRRRYPNRQRQQQQQFAQAFDYDEYNDNDRFYYGSRPSTKRSQNNPNFIQRGQQQLINQIRQLTWGQTPAEIGSAIRKSQASNDNTNRRLQQATLYVNRNGQTIYMAPELTQLTQPAQYQQVYAQPVVQKATSSPFPQPPLSVPYRQKGQPTQYITIPWSKLGISPPSSAISITEGIQTQPLILNIPQSAINTMHNQSLNRRKKKKRPQLITPDAVPLLADASLMNIFKPPEVPPSRTISVNKPMTSITSVLVAAKPSSTKTSTLLQQRIRPGTIVEKAPEVESAMKPSDSDTKIPQAMMEEEHQVTNDKEFILVGDDEEPGLTKQVQPAFGESRYVRLNGNSQFYDVLPRRRFTVRREGRELTPAEAINEELIPVEVISNPEIQASETVVKPIVAIAENEEEPKKENQKLSPDNLSVIPMLSEENVQQPPKPETT